MKSDAASIFTQSSYASPTTPSIPESSFCLQPKRVAIRDCLETAVSPTLTDFLREVSSYELPGTILAQGSILAQGIRDISTHAKAKELLTKAQREVYETADGAHDESKLCLPLSEQLATLGEIIAMERQFAGDEHVCLQIGVDNEIEQESHDCPLEPQPLLQKPLVCTSELKYSRRSSLVYSRTKSRVVPKATKIRRPHTAEGTSSRPRPLESGEYFLSAALIRMY
jgi:hypothetical protein